MSLVKLSISLGGEEQTVAVLGLAGEVIGDLRPTWESVGFPFMQDHARAQFLTAGEHGGKPWRGYEAEPKYRAYKRALVGHLDLLRWQKGGPFERFFPSLTKRYDPFALRIATPTSMSFGSTLDYAKKLTIGGVGPFGERFPGRDPTQMSTRQRRDFIREVQRDIVARVSRERLRTARVS